MSRDIFLPREEVHSKRGHGSKIELEEIQESAYMVNQLDMPRSNSTQIERQTLDQEVWIHEDTSTSRKFSSIILPLRRHKIMTTDEILLIEDHKISNYVEAKSSENSKR